jgi:hypothetical protein
MKALLIRVGVCLTCVVAATALGQEKRTDSTEQQIERKYDRFKNQTTVKLKPQVIRQVAQPREELSLAFEATYKGESPARPKEVVWIFDSVSERYLYHNEAEVIFIVNGKRIEAGTAYMATTLPSPNLVKVTLKLTTSFDRLAEVAAGKNVELKFGKTEISLAGKSMTALRSYAGSLAGP